MTPHYSELQNWSFPNGCSLVSHPGTHKKKQIRENLSNVNYEENGSMDVNKKEGLNELN